MTTQEPEGPFWGNVVVAVKGIPLFERTELNTKQDQIFPYVNYSLINMVPQVSRGQHSWLRELSFLQNGKGNEKPRQPCR